MAKDLFSRQAASYVGFRPGYPPEVIQHILSSTIGRQVAWDCATGNGQAAILLAPHFRQVLATDISGSQLAHAIPADNILYSTGSAENSGLADESVDLVTVAQAYHWLHFAQFEREVRRVARPGSTIAIWGYGLFFADIPLLNEKIRELYGGILGPYWDSERRWVEEEYRTIPFPFESIQGLNTRMSYTWDRGKLEGYIRSWSSVQHFIDRNGYNPVDSWMSDTAHLIEGTFTVHFPVFLKSGQV